MKQFVFSVLVLGGLMIGSPLFASGAEEEYAEAPYAEAPYADSTITDQWETITITGEVSFADWPNPEITSGRTTYELAVPGFVASDVGVEAGDTITVTGVLSDMRGASGDDPVLMVISAEIDGESYTVPMRGRGMGFANAPSDARRPDAPGRPGMDSRGRAPRGMRGAPTGRRF